MNSKVFVELAISQDYLDLTESLKKVSGLHLHHVAAKGGYISRKLDYVAEEYHGRFGEGFIILRPRWDTTRFVWCEYWVK